MSAQPKPYLTPTEYLAWERKQPFKSEYWNGQIYALAEVYARVELPPPPDLRERPQATR